MIIKIAVLWLTLTIFPQGQFKWQFDCCKPIYCQQPDCAKK
jgi:hypothetical protein